MQVSALALGTVKFGRNQKIKYAHFPLPSDKEIEALLDLALEAGINLLDTAPAYGASEERLGQLLGQRPFLLCTKTGEEFENGESFYDFSARHTESSVTRSLKRLRRTSLDCVLVHCSKDDLRIVRESEVLSTLARLKQKGDIRSFGISVNTPEGGLAAAEIVDVLMVTYNPLHKLEQAVIEKAAALHRGILIKKAFASGQLVSGGAPLTVKDCVRAAFELPGVSSLVTGTISPGHLRENAAAVRQVLTPASE